LEDKFMRKISIATFLILGFSIVSATAISASDASKTSVSEPVVISRLVMRDRIITISSQPTGLIYSVSSKDGTVLDASLSEAQLVAKYPEVYDHLRPAIANPDASKDVTPWAGM
jgi:hypothetical protein